MEVLRQALAATDPAAVLVPRRVLRRLLRAEFAGSYLLSDVLVVEDLERALALAPDHLSLYALTLDDPDAEGLTGELGDHLPTRSGARPNR